MGKTTFCLETEVSALKLSKFHVFEIILSIIAILYLSVEIQTSQIFYSLSNIEISWYFLIFLGFLIKFVAKSLKLRVLFEDRISFTTAFIITLKYNFYQNFVPFKAGDLTLVPMAKKEGFDSDISFGAIIINNSTLYLLSSLLLFLFSTIYIVFFGIEVKIELMLFALVLIISNILLLFLLFKPETFIRGYEIVTTKFKINKINAVSKSIEFLNKTALSIHKIRSNRSLFIRVIFYSLLTLLTQIPIYWASLEAVGFALHPIESMTFTFYFFFIQNLPIDLFLSFGKFEIAWAAFWVYAGYSFNEQLNLSFVMHAIHLILILLFGILGWIFDLLFSYLRTKKGK